MNDKEILNLIKVIREQEEQKELLKNVKPLEVPSPPKPLRFNFHHGQKVKVTGGYYKTYKGFIKDHRITKDNHIEYFIDLSKKDDELQQWINEDFLKIAYF